MTNQRNRHRIGDHGFIQMFFLGGHFMVKKHRLCHLHYDGMINGGKTHCKKNTPVIGLELNAS